MSISGRAGVAIGAGTILLLGTAGGVSYAAVNSGSSSQPAAPIVTAPLAPHAKIPTHTKWGKTLRVRHTHGHLIAGSVIVPCGPRVGSQTGASHQEAEAINDNRVTLVTIVWINITTIQTIDWNFPAPPVVLPVPTTPRPIPTKTPTKIVTPHGVALPDVTGEGQSKAQSDLSSAGFTNVTTNKVRGSAGDITGNVVGESPAAGSTLAPNARVTLTVVAGIQVPDETGAPANTALSDLSSLGFTNVVVNGDPTGTVSSQSPAGGSMLLANGRITLNTTASGSSTC